MTWVMGALVIAGPAALLARQSGCLLSGGPAIVAAASVASLVEG
jgi:hypothetical protein